MRTRRGWFVRLALLVLIAGIAWVSYAAYRHAHEGDRVKRASDRLSTPSGWKFVGVTQESGSPFLCIVSCFHPRITRVYRTDVPPREACAVIKAQVKRQIALPRRQTWDAGCGWRAPLEDVGSRADVGAYAEAAADLREFPTDRLPGNAAPTADGTYVYVTFSGGPT